ncbi:hypothetical protein BO71DRAFT_402559 [Aspergillus ellipticus CBS 707.79]|uniref:Uncharacterized protein n=1 Tax=Aspergillus ellipticus CBS 707.79 TaxID=1448320 RepID=A0A319DPQ3_9EURO|nr:hypothetical protein BO71DRAFT_402559 [Aspergillus ellipticus CBS 707.79]
MYQIEMLRSDGCHDGSNTISPSELLVTTRASRQQREATQIAHPKEKERIERRDQVEGPRTHLIGSGRARGDAGSGHHEKRKPVGERDDG